MVNITAVGDGYDALPTWRMPTYSSRRAVVPPSDLDFDSQLTMQQPLTTIVLCAQARSGEAASVKTLAYRATFPGDPGSLASQ
mmetsp:Transcript_18007/g.54215  ORF Transcript_18007/g.54215 Transcript_18007/m.54215 type:complete len:83 (+) Transcript_18007:69-317(+)